MADAIQVEMQRRHFYTVRHAAAAYRAKHETVDTDMG